MTQRWVREATAALDSNLAAGRGVWEEAGRVGPDNGSARLGGRRGRLGLMDLMELPGAEPFHQMLAHPAVAGRLASMLGADFRFSGGQAICSPREDEDGQATSGELLHGGALGSNPFEHPAAAQNMRHYVAVGAAGSAPQTFTPKVNVAWSLCDTAGPEDGGFVVLAGSTKANCPLPSDTLDDATIHEHAQHVALGRGDVLFFAGGAVCHGALPWRAVEARRTVIMQYTAAPVPRRSPRM